MGGSLFTLSQEISMRIPFSVGLFFVVLGQTFAAIPASAVELADGSTYFSQVPRLTKATSSPKYTKLRGATIQFTVAVPGDTDLPLQRLIIEQAKNAEALNISSDRISVVEGDEWSDQATPLPAQISISNDEILIEFDQPVPAGGVITIGLNPSLTPTTPGTYLYGITAHPTGPKPFHYFLGYGTVGFDDRTTDPRFFP
jgi:hypothetical protein